jgi:hypothetical protein
MILSIATKNTFVVIPQGVRYGVRYERWGTNQKA